jgi:hypothetical protein
MENYDLEEDLNPNFEYKTIIENFLRPYMFKIETHDFYKKYVNLELKYNHNYYRVPMTYISYLQLLSSYFLSQKFNPVNTIYQNIMEEKLYCKSIIRIDQMKDLLIYKSPHETYPSNDIPFSLIKDFVDCKFGVIEIFLFDGKENHTNLVFVEQQKLSKNRIRFLLNYYEPHGSIRPLIKDLLINIENDTRVIDDIEYNFEFIGYSSPEEEKVGFQSYTKEKFGFCNSFALLWLNIVLLIIKHNIQNNTYSSTNFWIEEVESYVISLLNQEEMFKVVLLYVSDIFNEYFSNVRNNNEYQELISKELINKNMIEINRKEYNHYFDELQKRIKPKASYKSQKEMVKKSLKNPEITYESWEREVNKELKEYKREKEILSNQNLKHLWKEVLKRRGYNTELKLIGKKCRNSKECFSGFCKNHICYPRV